jgi:hypothetical protein
LILCANNCAIDDADIQYDWIQEQVEFAEIKVRYVATDNNTGYFFTEGLHRPTHAQCTAEHGLAV